MIDQQKLKEQAQTFLRPFQPLGQAIIIFAKTTAGKTVGWVIIFIFVITSVTTLIHNNKRDDKGDFFFDGYYNDRSNDEKRNNPRARHDRQMRMFDAEMRATQARMARHRDELQRLFSMDEDLHTEEQDPKAVHQTISKVNIINDEQFGYTLSISGWILNGKLNGDNLTGAIARLWSADIILSSNTFSIPYSLETLEKVVNILDNK